MVVSFNIMIRNECKKVINFFVITVNFLPDTLKQGLYINLVLSRKYNHWLNQHHRRIPHPDCQFLPREHFTVHFSLPKHMKTTHTNIRCLKFFTIFTLAYQLVTNNSRVTERKD